MAEQVNAGAGPTRHAVQLGPLHAPKAGEVLAAELRERILTAEFPEGTALPPERELVARTGMSRATVREALHALEAQGLLAIRTGRAGGAFVTRPGEELVASSVSLLIRGRHIRMAALLETREGIEPVCARLAARYRDDADLARLEAANRGVADDSGSMEDFLRANVDWHVAVALASHNELLSGFMQALSRAIYAATDDRGLIDAPVRRTAARAHASILRAIRDRDEDAAARRMSRHVHSYAGAVAELERGASRSP